jgi:hypothetical protein
VARIREMRIMVHKPLVKLGRQEREERIILKMYLEMIYSEDWNLLLLA